MAPVFSLFPEMPLVFSLFPKIPLHSRYFAFSFFSPLVQQLLRPFPLFPEMPLLTPLSKIKTSLAIP